LLIRYVDPNVRLRIKYLPLTNKNSKMKIVLSIIMTMVRLIRGDECHYLSVSDDILSCIKSDRIMRIGHVTPSVVITLLLAIKVFPQLTMQNNLLKIQVLLQ